MILLARQAVEASSKKSLVNRLFPGFMICCLVARGPPFLIKFSGGGASCDGTGEPRHFQKRFQNQKRIQKKKSRPCSSKRNSKRWEETRWEETRWAGRRWEETRWAGRRWEGTRWAGRRWEETRWEGKKKEEREWEEKEGSRSTEGDEPKGQCQTREPS